MASAGAGRRNSSTVGQRWAYYRDATPLPLYSLIFIFPLVAVYEVGALMLRPTAWPERRLVAQGAMQSLFGWVGADAPWLSGAAIILVLTLLCWHIFSGGSWRVRVWVPAVMVVESIILCIPLLVIGRIGATMTLHQATSGTGFESLRADLILSLGAALYEEFVFRLAVLVIVLSALTHLFRTPRGVAMGGAVAVAAVIFALCHVRPVGAEEWDSVRMAVRLAAGAYLGIVFLLRGLGIAIGCHAAYDVVVLVGADRD
ncbi:MAG: CPBP family intramembrane metalloprotease [Phycisphaerales bacterium]|nr:CPBP family intramembrane metalloprotease [Phycisphaerales bacterium]